MKMRICERNLYIALHITDTCPRSCLNCPHSYPKRQLHSLISLLFSHLLMPLRPRWPHSCSGRAHAPSVFALSALSPDTWHNWLPPFFRLKGDIIFSQRGDISSKILSSLPFFFSALI